MLIPFQYLAISKPIKGVIHVGAHECEERDGYINYFKLNDANVVWVEAIPEKADAAKKRNPGIILFNHCVSDKDDQEVNFMVTNNYQSSSMLNFKTHSIEHPDVVETNRIKLKTKTLNTIFKENSLSPSNYNFMNLDIQGAELLALKGSYEILPHIDYIYSEVNSKELYEGCALLPELDQFLETFGFKRIQTNMTPHGWGDAFYAKF